MYYLTDKITPVLKHTVLMNEENIAYRSSFVLSDSTEPKHFTDN